MTKVKAVPTGVMISYAKTANDAKRDVDQWWGAGVSKTGSFIKAWVFVPFMTTGVDTNTTDV